MGFWVEISTRGRFATPADFRLHDCSPYRGLHVRRECLPFVHGSNAIFCRPMPKLQTLRFALSRRGSLISTLARGVYSPRTCVDHHCRYVVPEWVQPQALCRQLSDKLDQTLSTHAPPAMLPPTLQVGEDTNTTQGTWLYLPTRPQGASSAQPAGAVEAQDSTSPGKRDQRYTVHDRIAHRDGHGITMCNLRIKPFGGLARRQKMALERETTPNLSSISAGLGSEETAA